MDEDLSLSSMGKAGHDGAQVIIPSAREENGELQATKKPALN